MFKSKAAIARYFDQWAPRYDRDLTRYEYAVPQAVFDTLAPGLVRGARVLEIGIGTGLSVAPLRQAVPELHVTGIDISTRMLALAEAKGVAERLVLCDISRDAVPPGPYDGIITAGVLEFLAHVEDVTQVLGTQLRRGGMGVLVFESPMTAHLYEGGVFAGVVARSPRSVQVRRIQPGLPLPHVYTKHLHDVGHVLFACREAGLEAVHVETFKAYTRGRRGAVAYALVRVTKP